ncbi:MAG TPA: hypothetical protein VNJ02_00925 [Vicinamibacterales bacterium]|nr:hypothetical protein [Vicinamibacterales bacterium]
MPENAHPEGPLELKPLLMAVEKVLKDLGQSSVLDERVKTSVAELQKQHKKYLECCFFAMVVKGRNE